MRLQYFIPIILFFSCTTIKRYKSIEQTRNDTSKLVTVSLFGTKVDQAKEEDPSKSLWDLQAEGQATLIKEMSERNSSDDEKFINALNSKYLKAKEKIATDYTARDLRLIFSIGKKRDYLQLAKQDPTYTLGDRIEYLKLDITIPDSVHLNFIKWNRFATEYTTIDVADASFNQSLSLTAGTGLSSSVGSEKTIDSEKTTRSTGLTPSVSATGTTGKTETQKIRFRYVSLNGKISDKQISIEQEGFREIDLTGNVSADINVKFDEFPETLTSMEGFKTSEGAYNLSGKIKTTLFTAMVPVIENLPLTIDAKLNYEYAYRHVKKGADTYYEWDDKIEYIKGVDSITIPLLKRKDFLPAFHNIAGKNEGALAANQRTRLMLVDTSSTDTTEMIFANLAAGQEFWNWITRYNCAQADLDKPILLGTYKLIIRAGGIDREMTKRYFNSIKNNMEVLAYYR